MFRSSRIHGITGWVAAAVVDRVGRLEVAEVWAVEAETMAVGLAG